MQAARQTFRLKLPLLEQACHFQSSCVGNSALDATAFGGGSEWEDAVNGLMLL